MNRRVLVTIAILSVPLASHAATRTASRKNTTTSRQVIAEVLRIDQERADAFVNNDTAALDRIMADDCTYVHPNGRVETKAEVLEGLKNHDRTYVSIERDDVKVRVFRTIAIVTGRNNLKAKYQGKDYNVQNRFLRVYEKRNGRWQLVAHQATSMPKP